MAASYPLNGPSSAAASGPFPSLSAGSAVSFTTMDKPIKDPLIATHDHHRRTTDV
jgi:hypothetical protein